MLHRGCHTSILSLLVTCVLITSCKPELPADVSLAYNALPDQLDYNLHVKPVLSDKCFACHGPDKGKRKAGLRLDDPSSSLADLPESPGKVAIDPGDLKDSELFHRILSSGNINVMCSLPFWLKAMGLLENIVNGQSNFIAAQMLN